jgi:hypothetical protein
MNKSKRFSPEVRERAVRLVQEHRGEYPSLWPSVLWTGVIVQELGERKLGHCPGSD